MDAGCCGHRVSRGTSFADGSCEGGIVRLLIIAQAVGDAVDLPGSAGNRGIDDIADGVQLGDANGERTSRGIAGLRSPWCWRRRPLRFRYEADVIPGGADIGSSNAQRGEFLHQRLVIAIDRAGRIGRLIVGGVHLDVDRGDIGRAGDRRACRDRQRHPRAVPVVCDGGCLACRDESEAEEKKCEEKTAHMVTSLVMIGLIVGAAVGLLVGALAGHILPGQARMGRSGDLLVGALGGFLGVLLDAWLAHGDITSASPAIVAVGLIGAVVLLNIARRMPRPSA